MNAEYHTYCLNVKACDWKIVFYIQNISHEIFSVKGISGLEIGSFTVYRYTIPYKRNQLHTTTI